MARIPEGAERGPLTVAARRVLLDAIAALDEQREAVVLVGAQAVHLRTEHADVGVAAFTSDGDLGIDRTRLKGEPHLDVVMEAAGFRQTPNQPGLWTRPERVGDVVVNIAVDLLVPEVFGGGGSRAARIPPHGRMAARKVSGLELVMVDNDVRLIVSLEPEVDSRSAEIKVAGVAALLVAKAYKIRDRLAEGKPGREADKDAGDVMWLMATSDVEAVAARFDELLTHPDVGSVAREGLSAMRAQFGAPRAQGIEMAVGALAGSSLAEGTIRAVGPAFIANLNRR